MIKQIPSRPGRAGSPQATSAMTSLSPIPTRSEICKKFSRRAVQDFKRPDQFGERLVAMDRDEREAWFDRLVARVLG